eukprot:CAMPEP_0117540914 /NCGR_PEP_ID=MMETSP0784-20121206/43744_1 /TAXON_ID=39447 /ORGANISM="" /LENGTH=492 /DNA_ID=CAMNT_0005337583 /DNA_START=82 /DNA_END=1557 /DNA_ORIENTATION=-
MLRLIVCGLLPAQVALQGSPRFPPDSSSRCLSPDSREAVEAPCASAPDTQCRAESSGLSALQKSMVIRHASDDHDEVPPVKIAHAAEHTNATVAGQSLALHEEHGSSHTASTPNLSVVAASSSATASNRSTKSSVQEVHALERSPIAPPAMLAIRKAGPASVLPEIAVTSILVVLFAGMCAVSFHFFKPSSSDGKWWYEADNLQRHDTALPSRPSVARPPVLMPALPSYRRDQGQAVGDGHNSRKELQGRPSPRAEVANPQPRVVGGPRSSMVAGAAGGSNFSLAPSIRDRPIFPDRLCPGLVVPPSQECILAVRAPWGRPAQRPKPTVEITDLDGYAVLVAEIRTGAALKSKTSPAVVLRVPSFDTPRVDDADDIYATCRIGEAPHGPRCMHIYNRDDMLYGSLFRGSGNNGRSRYAFTSGRGISQLILDGKYFEHSIVIVNERYERVADIEPCELAVDPTARFYKLRVSAGADVGLVLSCLLSIEQMEAD